MTFGTMIRSRRESLSLSQEELAVRSGISVRNLRDLESGRIRRPRQKTVRLLAEALSLSGAEQHDFYRWSRAAEQPVPVADAETAALWSGRPTPAQLPSDIGAFVGRADLLTTMDALLGEKAPAHGVTIAVVGPACIGKPDPGI